MRFAQVPPGRGGVPFCISGENAVRSKEFFSRCRSDCFCLPAGIVAAHVSLADFLTDLTD